MANARNDKTFIVVAGLGGLALGYLIANAMANQRIAQIQQAIQQAQQANPNSNLASIASIASSGVSLFDTITNLFKKQPVPSTTPNQ